MSKQTNVLGLIERDMIVITHKEYRRLVERSQWLEYLEAAGVDNWGGYEVAQELRELDRD